MELHEFVAAKAAELGVPGAAVGVLVDGAEVFAGHGVTRVGGTEAIDRDTLFHLASVSKTFTATALMRLVALGKVELDAPVRRYVPDLQLADADAAERITVLNLLNHTAGLDWNLVGDLDPTLAGFVAKLAELPQIASPGSRASYSQAGFNLVGRIIENVTELPYEQAMASLLFEPLGLTNTVFDIDDVMIRKFAVGHNPDADGVLRPAVPWKAWKAGDRGNNPGGGVVSTVGDLLQWAKFQLGDGAGLLPASVLHGMRDETVALRASTLGDGFGICWFRKTIDGVLTIGHGGSGNGQYAELLVVPSTGFAVVSLTNSGPDGYQLNQAVLRWALEHYLGLVERAPEPLPYDEARAVEMAGRYENDAMNVDIVAEGTNITLAVEIKPELRASTEATIPPDLPAAALALLPDDEFVITAGGLAGQRGYFTRGTDGRITGGDLAGRLFARTSA
ncbi:class A beta-lactamase-related serine hydrolase [Kribbella antibiotica]|uniref:Class A beta-lactamase-related serine hydrolase n=1 Tax=Kribbella antibiotica TaxID=190195 RepID=A0A4R4ZNL8_9ACTN|nr:serine hydrolase domain-containing protein [Kribbella antibiotica]TDD60443.1 class A beta-lactamase-related serine hydrolase [Kribbella antibiotica]